MGDFSSAIEQLTKALEVYRTHSTLYHHLALNEIYLG